MSSTRSRSIALRVVPRDEAAAPLAEIYRRYCPYVAAVVLRLVGRSEQVEDLVQDVFLEAARGLQRLRHPEAIKGWLATISVRIAGRHLRRRRLRRLLGLDLPADYSGLVDPGASPLDRVLLAAVYRILDDTPVADRLAFSLHHLEGEKLEVVGELLGCSPATTKRRIARVQARIKEAFGDG